MGYFSTTVKEEGNLVEISGFPINEFRKSIYRQYRSKKISSFFFSTFILFGRGTIKIHKSFAPELYYLLNNFGYYNICDMIIQNTWMRSTIENFPSSLNPSLLSDFGYSLKPYQLEFLKIYDNKKQKYNLNGYVLAFEQGLGKTFTSLALMHCLKKDSVIIIAPKSTLKTVWKNEIETVFKDKQDMWIIGDSPKKARFYIVNYESIEKLNNIMKYVMQGKNTGIIVDESHNFTNFKAQRVIRLKAIAKVTNCNDILLMSGTPIRAMGGEMIPTLELLDPYFDDFSRKVFTAAFGIKIPIALDILNNRLGIMMHRKMKKDVLDLPSKTRIEMKVKISDGNKYTIEEVKNTVVKFVEKRKEFYQKNRKMFEDEFEEVIDYLKKELKDDKDFKMYLDTVEYLKKYSYDARDKNLVTRVATANDYEKNVLRNLLTSDLKKKFDRSKAVVKYLNLKIMGEALGGLLNNLRAEMFSKMIKSSQLCNIIEKSKKKTVCFSTYVDVVKSTYDFLISSCKYDPILIFGETSSAIIPLLKSFKEETNKNPLVATIQTLSTGVTLTEANTVVFLNRPWRHTDELQASDRVHRIGQDTEVVIYTMVLDTGVKSNLSTRMEDIINWSKDMFEGIVGNKSDVEIVVDRFRNRLLG